MTAIVDAGQMPLAVGNWEGRCRYFQTGSALACRNTDGAESRPMALGSGGSIIDISGTPDSRAALIHFVAKQRATWKGKAICSQCEGMLRIDADGQVLWAHTRPKSEFPKWKLRSVVNGKETVAVFSVGLGEKDVRIGNLTVPCQSFSSVLVRFGPTGQVVWSSPGDPSAFQLRPDGVALVMTQGSEHDRLMAIDPTGAVSWQYHSGGPSESALTALATIDDFDAVALMGDGSVCRISASGEEKWCTREAEGASHTIAVIDAMPVLIFRRADSSGTRLDWYASVLEPVSGKKMSESKLLEHAVPSAKFVSAPERLYAYLYYSTLSLLPQSGNASLKQVGIGGAIALEIGVE